MLTRQEREFHSNRLRRATHRGGLVIVAHALAYYTGHLIGRGFGALNQLTHRHHHLGG